MEPLKLNDLSIETPLLKAKVEYQEGAPSSAKNFGQVLDNAITDLKDVQMEAAQSMQDFASGKDVDISQVMLSVERAAMSTDLALQVRNKMVEAYQEINRIQI